MEQDYSTEDIVEARLDQIDEHLHTERQATQVAVEDLPDLPQAEPALEPPANVDVPEGEIAPPENYQPGDVPYHLIGIEPPDENDPGRQLVESLDKPAEEYGLKENILEGSMALVQGHLTGLRSMTTAVERYKDMMAGENVGGADYVPEWDPLRNTAQPILKTKWGSVLETISHYSTIGAPLATVGLGPLAVAGGSAALSDKSQQPESDPMSAFQKLMPFLNDIPLIRDLDVEDTDHPLLKTAKNTLQEMGLAKAFDVALQALFPGNPKFKQIADAETANVDRQIGEMAIEQVRVRDLGPTPPGQLPGQGDVPRLPPAEFQGYANKPVADLHQGNATPTGKPSDVLDQLNRIDNENITGGSTDPIFTRAQTRRMANENGMSADEMRDIAEDLMSSERYADLVDEAVAARKTVSEVFEPSYRRFQQIIGHDAMKLSPEEYYKPILDDLPMQTGEGPATGNIAAFSSENVVVTDLVVSHLLKQAQTQAKAAREIMEYADIWAVDGPMAGLRDNIVFGLGQARRARKLASYNLSKLRQKGGPLKFDSPDLTPEAFAKSLDDDFAATRTNIDFFFKVVEEIGDPDLNKTIVDIFSSAENTRNWLDLEAYMRKKVRGGEFVVSTKGDLRKKSGALIREMQGVWMNSALNSPKTPQRAMIGTAELTFFRALSRMMGAHARKLVGAGDEAGFSAIEATAEFAAFFEALPDAWKIFSSRLKQNFSTAGSYNSRFQRYNQNEFNWDWADKFYSQRGTKADKAWYNTAKTFRFFNSSTKIPALLSSYAPRVMGPMDEGWTFVAAKMRARGLAYRNALEEQARGNLTEITPEVIKRADELYFNNLLDAEGNIDIFKDPYLAKRVQENTLTTPLEGMPKGLQSFMNSNPILGRFMAFATPGFNDIKINLENIPLTGAAFGEQKAILKATAENWQETVSRYGIKNLDDLQAAKEDVVGRQIVGSAVMMAYAHSYLKGNTSGGGDIDPGQERALAAAGARTDQIKIGPVGVPISLLQTHHIMLRLMNVIGDNAHKMGPEWVDSSHVKITAALADVITSSSMLTQLNDLIDLLTFQPGASVGKVAASQLNTQIPYGGLRNDLGNALNPYLKEINADLVSSVLNRNKFLGVTSGDITSNPLDLPDKSNILNGKKLNQQPPFMQFFNAVSAVPLDLNSDSKALDLLLDSNYNMRTLTYSTPDGTSLQDYPDIRAAFQEAIGNWRGSQLGESGKSIEEILDMYASREEVQDSIALMKAEVGYQTKFNAVLGDKESQQLLMRDPMKYTHNRLIQSLFDRARNEAWQTLGDREDVQQLEAEAQDLRAAEYQMGLLQPVLEYNNQ